MFARIRKTLSVIVLLAFLAACSSPAPVEVAPPSPSAVENIASTPKGTAETQPSPAPVGFNCQTIQEISVEECLGLVALYESTNGAQWLDHSGWLESATPCSWYGVICEEGHVVELQLFYNELAGHLPPEIGNLTNLKSLYLDDNKLSGPLPAEIGNLTELQTARLGGNQFNAIPVEFGNLNNLTYLELWGNQLSGEIPDEISKLTKLQDLNLSSNQLTGSIPPELGNLGFLHNLNLSHNQLSGSMPGTLGDLRSLNQLDLSFNQLTGSIPVEVADLAQLYWLDLSYNQLTGVVPEPIIQAPISERRLWGNQFDGTVMASRATSTPVEYQGVQFEFSSDLAQSVWPEIVPALEPNPGEAVWLHWPEHIRFTFAYPRKPDGSEVGRSTGFGPPQILIYPTEAYSTLSELAKTEIDELQSLLGTRPPVVENEIPALPIINAAQVFQAQLEYVDFQNGKGVRFLTMYSQDVIPITNQNIFYTFQGLTDDGAYYVAAFFPIATEGLPDEPLVEDWDAFSAGYRDYLAESASQLDALSSEDFEPDLEALDQVIQSLMVNIP